MQRCSLWSATSPDLSSEAKCVYLEYAQCSQGLPVVVPRPLLTTGSRFGKKGSRQPAVRSIHLLFSNYTFSPGVILTLHVFPWTTRIPLDYTESPGLHGIPLDILLSPPPHGEVLHSHLSVPLHAPEESPWPLYCTPRSV